MPSRPRATLLSTAMAASLAAAVLVPLTAGTARAATAAKADDFNGDGYRDYAFHLEWTAEADKSGAVKIVFGDANGPGTRTQVVHQNSAGVPGANENGDRFGEVRASADFNRDGYADLAVGNPGENDDRGAVNVLWGSATGLSGGTSIPNRDPNGGNVFGHDLAVGDFNGDGKADLATLNAVEAFVYRGSIDKTGVHGSSAKVPTDGFSPETIAAGQVTGSTATDLVMTGVVPIRGTNRYSSAAGVVRGGSSLTWAKSLVYDKTERYDGETVVADFDKDGYGDIAIGNPEYSSHRGEVTVWHGGNSAMGSSRRISQYTRDVVGTREEGDDFGWYLSAGDVNGDGYQDLAVGVSGEDLGSREDVGGVNVLKGGRDGLTGTGSAWFDRETPGVPGTAGTSEHFAATRLRDSNTDGYADLFVHDEFDNVDVPLGMVRLRGGSSGISASGASVPSIPGRDINLGLFSQESWPTPKPATPNRG
jgi:hypothetical protein